MPHTDDTKAAAARFAEANDIDTAMTMLRFENGALDLVETARHSEWGDDIRTEVAGGSGKVIIEARPKTPATFSRRFAFEGGPPSRAEGRPVRVDEVRT